MAPELEFGGFIPDDTPPEPLQQSFVVPSPYGVLVKLLGAVDGRNAYFALLNTAKKLTAQHNNSELCPAISFNTSGGKFVSIAETKPVE